MEIDNEEDDLGYEAGDVPFDNADSYDDKLKDDFLALNRSTDNEWLDGNWLYVIFWFLSFHD